MLSELGWIGRIGDVVMSERGLLGFWVGLLGFGVDCFGFWLGLEGIRHLGWEETRRACMVGLLF